MAVGRVGEGHGGRLGRTGRPPAPAPSAVSAPPAGGVDEEIRAVGDALRKKYAEDSRAVGALQALSALREWALWPGRDMGDLLMRLDEETAAADKRHHVLQNDIKTYRFRLAALKNRDPGGGYA